MSLDIEHYSLILARRRRAELVDRLILEQRRASMRASLIVDPVTLHPYAVVVNDPAGARATPSKIDGGTSRCDVEGYEVRQSGEFNR